MKEKKSQRAHRTPAHPLSLLTADAFTAAQGEHRYIYILQCFRPRRWAKPANPENPKSLPGLSPSPPPPPVRR